MRVVEPTAFKDVKHPKKKRKHHIGLRVSALLIIAVYVSVSLIRPLPVIQATPVTVKPTNTQNVAIAWPSTGQAAIGAVGYGVLATHNEQKSLPTASVAKVMTALAVLKKKPLRQGEQGPIITKTQEYVNDNVLTGANDGSNLPVALGEEITQYEALQALLLPSANNMAYTLARWAYGSDENYLTFVNNFSKSLGMQNTYFDDASGFSSNTKSTPEDLVKLAVNAMDNPVIAEIAAQTDAVIPVAGKIYNVNMLLGRNGIVGLKTGNTEDAGGCFMAAAVRIIGGQKVVAVSVITGSPNLFTALRDSVPLITSVLDGFEEKTLIKAGDVLGSYAAPWGEDSTVIAKNDITGVIWKANSVKPEVALDPLSLTTASNAKTGTVFAQFGRNKVESDLLLSNTLTSPSLLWRLMPRF